MTIVGVTNESSAKIKSFIEEKGIKYLIAIGSANEYPTQSIPHGWLVAANGKVVWEGHPGNLTEKQIEDELKNVRLGPQFELPRELKKAEVLLNNQKYADGIEELEKYLKKPKDAAVGEKAKAALDQILEYGKSTLEEADSKVQEGRYDVALKRLEELEKSFKGHDLSTRAKDKLDALKDNKDLKLEIEAAGCIVKAEAYLNAGGARQAAKELLKVTKRKKFAETKMLAVAEELLKEAEAALTR